MAKPLMELLQEWEWEAIDAEKIAKRIYFEALSRAPAFPTREEAAAIKAELDEALAFITERNGILTFCTEWIVPVWFLKLGTTGERRFLRNGEAPHS